MITISGGVFGFGDTSPTCATCTHLDTNCGVEYEVLLPQMKMWVLFL